MDNNSLLQTIFLVAAINTLIIAIAIYIIFKIRVKKEKKEKSITKEKKNIIAEEAAQEIMEEKKEPVKPQIKPQIIDLKEEKSKSEKEIKPKFLKYTSKGYIIPQDDEEKEKLRWQ
jgi:LAS superfamily LD-carboxypeptidase LdcB